LNLAIFPLFFILAIPLALIVGLVVVSLAKILKGGSRRGLSEEESQIMQDIHQGLGRMERRIESLETILFDRVRKDGE